MSSDQDPRDIFYDLWGHWLWMSAYIAIIGGSAVELTGRWSYIPILMIMELFQFQSHVETRHKGLHPITTSLGDIVSMAAFIVLVAVAVFATLCQHSVTVTAQLLLVLPLLVVGQVLFSHQVHMMHDGESMLMQRLPRNQVMMEFFRLNVFMLCNVVAFMIMISSR